MKNSEMKLSSFWWWEKKWDQYLYCVNISLLPDTVDIAVGFNRLAEWLKSNVVLRAYSTTTAIPVGKSSSCFWMEAALRLWNYYFVC